MFLVFPFPVKHRLRKYYIISHCFREIEDTILLSLNNPQVYDDIARGTRRKFESNRPRAVLFEGPPGLLFNQERNIDSIIVKMHF